MKVYKKLFAYVPNDKIFGILAILLSGISAMLMVWGYYCIYLFLREVVVQSSGERASVLSVKIVVFLTTGGILYLVSGLSSHKMAFRLETNLRKKGIEGLTDAGFRFFDMHSSGYIRKTIDDNAAKTHVAVAHMLPDNMQALMVPILALVLAFTISFRVGMAILTLTIVSSILLMGMMGEQKFMKLYQASLDKLSAETVEYIRGMQVVKIFGARLKSFKALHEAIMNYSKYAFDYSISCQKPYVLYQLFFFGLIAVITIPLSFFLNSIVNPKMFAVELLMVFFLSGVMVVSFMKIMWASMNMYNANYAIDKLEELYTSMKEDSLRFGTREQFENHRIEFENVRFSYGEHPVLEDLSFTLEEHKTYALVGHSGSGKSTIAKLLSGFYNVDGGVIKIGGYPLNTYTKEAIIQNISFVFQDSKLFKKSIYENVVLAKKNATREEVLQALHLAGCDEILAKFPMRENTIIGSKGVYLSGGEVQRIAIARAILKNSPIVVMDEASAAVDADNEYELQLAFRNLMKHKTVIMIAHRMSSIQSVDEILVLQHGKVVERGNHTELMQKQGMYSKLLHLYERANNWRV